MKKTVPLKKDLKFNSNLAEIISISLDHELKLDNRTVKGTLIISGTYKINDVSVNTESFNFNIPVNIEMSDKYILDDLEITIDDFFYEIIDNSILSVNIEIGLNNLSEKEQNPIKYEEEIVEKVSNDRVEVKDVKNLFDNFDDNQENYSVYKVCIVKENDTLESIIVNYGITRELLEQYNDLTDVKIGDKLIIPSLFNETN